MTEQLDVGEAKLWDGAPTAACTATEEWVGCAGGDLLGGQDREAAGGDLDVGLDHLSGSESPAGATLALVLDRSDCSLLPPVHGVGQVQVDWLGSLHGGGGWGGGLLVTSQVVGSELCLGQVTELVDSHLVGEPRLAVVLVDLLDILLEDIHPEFCLSAAGVALAVGSQENMVETLTDGVICLKEMQK